LGFGDGVASNLRKGVREVLIVFLCLVVVEGFEGVVVVFVGGVGGDGVGDGGAEVEVEDYLAIIVCRGG
jgi:hypothetical protein